jgi:hypothetical protein
VDVNFVLRHRQADVLLLRGSARELVGLARAKRHRVHLLSEIRTNVELQPLRRFSFLRFAPAASPDVAARCAVLLGDRGLVVATVA